MMRFQSFIFSFIYRFSHKRRPISKILYFEYFTFHIFDDYIRKICSILKTGVFFESFEGLYSDVGEGGVAVNCEKKHNNLYHLKEFSQVVGDLSGRNYAIYNMRTSFSCGQWRRDR